MLRSILPIPTLDHYLSLNGEGDGGGDGGGTGNGGAGGGDAGGSSGGDDGKGTGKTQADIDRAASAARSEGARKAKTELAEKLGVSIEEAESIIAAHKAKVEGDKDEVQRAKDAATAAETKANEATAAAAKATLEARITKALVRSHVKDDALDDSMRLMDVAPEATDDEVTAAVGAFAKRRPEFFEASDGGDGDEGGEGDAGDGTPPPPGDPATRRKPKGSEDAFARGAERAKKTAGDEAEYPILQSLGK